MDEVSLIEKLIKIEALYAGAATEGERISADRARQRILTRLQDLISEDPPVEFKFTFTDVWSRKIFLSLLRRYTLNPYRYSGQRYTTVMVQVPKSFVDETLWPEFEKIDAELKGYLEAITDRVVKSVLHEDSSDAVVVDQPIQIGFGQKPPIKAKPDPPPNPTKPNSAKRKRNKNRKKKRRKR